MSNRLRDRILRPLRDSIRGQILTALVSLLVFCALVLALLFGVMGTMKAKQQIQDSYEATASMVASLSAYDFQFNKSGLKETVEALLEADGNIIWAEFVDTTGRRIDGKGVLGEAPEEARRPLQGMGTHVQEIGVGILVRAPILVERSQSGGFSELGFEQPAASGTAERRAVGELRLVVGLVALEELKRSYWVFGFLAVLATFAVGAIVAWAIAKYLVAPIAHISAYAQKIAEGDLSVKGEAGTRRDELGRLLLSFEAMAGNLSAMIMRIRTAFQGVQKDTESLSTILEKNLENNRDQVGKTEEVQESLGSIQTSSSEVAGLMEGLSQLAEEVSSSVLQMVANIDQIAQNAEGLTDAVNTAASTLTENVASTREIETSAATLNQYVEETSTAMAEMEGTIRQVEQNATETKKATEAVMKEARSGSDAVEHSEGVIRQLQESFSSTVDAVRLLGQRSEEVGNILSVIDEVMEQTHLLALNAAIIAAQAGEHGKSFAVVAGEIRALAEKTSLSTREIAEIISSVQTEVQAAVESVSAQSALVEQTVEVTSDTRTALGRIKASVAPSLSMVQEIARATGEQARAAEGIVKSTETLRDLSHQLQHATSEQRGGSEQVLEATDRIRSLADEVKRATREQSAGSTLIRQAMESLTNSAGQVLQQMQQQGAASQEVERLMETFSAANRSNMSSLQEASDQVEGLMKRAETVAREMAQFRTRES